MTIFERLNEMRKHGGAVSSRGLPDDVIARFAKTDSSLIEAIEAAHSEFVRLQNDEPELLAMDEEQQIKELQANYINFYPNDAIHPYVGLSGRGPWIISLKGAVVYDAGGYGMLGLGHAPEAVLNAMNVDGLDLLGHLPRYVAAVSLAMVAGFLSLIPGGLGVRDLILTQLTEPYFAGDEGVSCTLAPAAAAVVSAVLLRAVWLLAELISSGILYVSVPRRRREKTPEDTEHDADAAETS